MTAENPVPFEIILDADSTLYRIETLDRLGKISLQGHAEERQRTEEISRITDLGMHAEIGFRESLERRVPLLDATRAHVDILAEELKDEICPSMREHMDWFEANVDRIRVVSGGFRDYMIPSLVLLGIPEERVHANTFIYDAEDRIVDFDRENPLSMDDGKVALVRSLGIAGRIVGIGDGANDLALRTHGVVDEFWAYALHKPRPSVMAQADLVITDFAQVAALTA